MELLLDVEHPILHALYLLRHGPDSFIPLLDQLSQLLDRSIFLNDVNLHDLYRLLVLCNLPSEVRLVSLLDLFQLIDFLAKVAVGLNSVSHLLVHLFLCLFYFLGHLVPQSRLELNFLLDKSLLLIGGILDLSL